MKTISELEMYGITGGAPSIDSSAGYDAGWVGMALICLCVPPVAAIHLARMTLK